MTPIETPRLVIRELRPEDEAALIALASDGSLTEIFGDCADCGSWMGKWSQEARQSFTAYFFRTYAEDRLFATAKAENRASCKTLEKAGFALTGAGFYQDMYDEQVEMNNFYEITRDSLFS